MVFSEKQDAVGETESTFRWDWMVSEPVNDVLHKFDKNVLRPAAEPVKKSAPRVR